jgi:NADPH2:quinone reductase
MENTEGEYKVIELEKFNGQLRMSTRKLRKLEKGEILVKVMRSTIHPADSHFLKGIFGFEEDNPKVLPTVPGLEGCGDVVKVGENIDSSLIGKRVGVLKLPKSSMESFEGLWAQYVYVTQECILPFKTDIDYDKIAFSLANPLTVINMMEILKKRNAKCVAQNGSGSALGKMLIKLCKANGITTINLVRKEEQISHLLEIGGNYVLSTQNEDWKNQFSKICSNQDARVCFECVGGSMTGQILSLLPKKSEVINYGNLEFQPICDISSKDLIFLGKTLSGLFVSDWRFSLKKEEMEGVLENIRSSIESGSDVFCTGINKHFQLEDFEAAINEYFSDMSKGKILFTPHN